MTDISAPSPVRLLKARRMTLKQRRQVSGFVFALPAIALVVCFIGIPIGQAVYYSFTQWDGLTSTWIGPSTWTQAFHTQTGIYANLLGTHRVPVTPSAVIELGSPTS